MKCQLKTIIGTTITSICMIVVSSVYAEKVDATAQVEFFGTSTLHDFHGKVPVAPFTIEYSQERDDQILLSGGSSLKVSEMDTDSKGRDKNMRKMFEAKEYPLISGSIEKVTLPLTGESDATVKIKIRDVEKEIPATLFGFEKTAEKVKCSIRFTVSLPEFEIKPPSIMGMIKVGETVEVTCHVEAALPEA